MIKSKIFEQYPNIFKEDLPSCAFCATHVNKVEAKMAFKKFCPEKFEVEDLRHAKLDKKPVCQWEVDYVLQDGEDLPCSGSELTQIFECLMKFHPMDTKIKQKQLTTPKVATIVYEVICDCEAPTF